MVDAQQQAPHRQLIESMEHLHRLSLIMNVNLNQMGSWLQMQSVFFPKGRSKRQNIPRTVTQRNWSIRKCICSTGRDKIFVHGKNGHLWINMTFAVSCVYGSFYGNYLRTLGNMLNGHFFVLSRAHSGPNKMADILQTTFSNAFSWIRIHIFWFNFHWYFFSADPMNFKPALVQVVVLLRTGENPFHELMIAYFTDAYMRHSASMS